MISIQDFLSGYWRKMIGQPDPETPAPIDRTQVTLVDGGPVMPGHKEILPNGQQADYIVLSSEERAKGFARLVRDTYQHVGPLGPQYETRPTGDDEKLRYGSDVVLYETYPPGGSVSGRYWRQEHLDRVGKGCGGFTTMNLALAETYARDTGFYGATFCSKCAAHFPVEEFVWDGTTERVGS